ncbi:unnamed protein product [Caenorhabditis auriculariae]|uniref:ABC transporter domain-containing protein n=1 Tax=Caenorhabditis auriculariae TaxID=2777116 RepID=A0A8S1GZ27_9PELO|nr:unnamed protein product [Caenorhabditis auriculariae]
MPDERRSPSTARNAFRSNSEKSLKVVPITVSWEHITVKAENGREILQNVNGFTKPGQLMALMGASGAGKTTLLNTLMARNLRGLEHSGNIRVNGIDMGKDISRVSGFAQQEELFIGTLTVHEYLLIQAKLRIDEDSVVRKERVDEVMVQLGLVKCQNSRIGVVGVKKGISGGEARRLTFACEMLSNPSLLFADEPTSGLDSFMAENVVQLLRTFAANGRTIICTIHQPASQLYQMFDSVMYMANGRTAFLGSPEDSITFFEKSGHVVPPKFNPSEYIISVLAVVPGEEAECKKRIDKIVEAFESSDHGQKVNDYLSSLEIGEAPQWLSRVGFTSQITALAERCFLDIMRNPGVARAKFTQKCVMGLFIGLLYLQTEYTPHGIQNINGALFFVVCELTFSTMAGIMTFLNIEFPLVAREYHDGLYNLASYYIARIVSYMPLFSSDGLCMILISYWLIGLSSTFQQVLWMILVAVLTEQAASSCGIALSCICPSVPITVASSGPILILFMLVGGFYGTTSSMPIFIQWIQYTSWNRLAYEALMINQWSRLDDAHGGKNWTVQNRDAILHRHGFEAWMFFFDLGGLATIAIVLYFIGFVALLFRIRRAR